MKRIVHFSTYNKGGAGIAARRIFSGLHDQLQGRDRIPVRPGGVQPGASLRFVCRGDQELPDEWTDHFQSREPRIYKWLPRKLNHTKSAAKHFYRHLENRPPDFEVVSPAVDFDPTALTRDFRADLIHLHWVAYLFDYPSFFQSISRRVPIVWTLHDMNAFTGGCHYSSGCDRYLSGCGSCFQMDNPGPTDLSAVSMKHKKRAYRHRNMAIVAPSRWLLKEAERSRIFPGGTRFELIPYGLDLEAFQPLNKRDAKQQLSSDTTGSLVDRVTLLFGADDFTIKRKGIHLLREALGKLRPETPVTCLVFGNGDLKQLEPENLDPQIEIRQLGYLSTDEEKRLAYSAADVFVLPSLEDNQPQTGLEAMACGTPVVAFNTGGMPDFVRHQKTGRLADSIDAESLAREIGWTIENATARQSYGEAARRVVCEEYEIKTQTAKYIQLYDSLIGPLSSAQKAA